MIKKRMRFLTFMSLSLIVLISACKKDEDEPTVVIPTDNRVFIANEGPFMSGSGTLSIYDRETGEVINNAFESVNGFPLGNIVQSVNVYNDKVYIAVNNAAKVEVVLKEDMVSTGTIDINLPRYFLGVNEQKGYVSSWDNKVYIVDLTSNTVTGNIPTATGPERMLLVGDEAWILNQGGYSVDSTLTIINTVTDEVIKTLVVGDKPTGIVRDKNNKVWVLCSGNGWNGFPDPNDTKGRLVCFDPSDHSILKELEFPNDSMHPERLVINSRGETMFYMYDKELTGGGIISQSIESQNLDLELILGSTLSFYSIGYDHVTDLLYVTDPVDFIQDGKVYMIDPVTKTLINTITAGLIPGDMDFN